jgi:LDH2 family malate/lactate/ureidoglycolate dehydrogenase
VFTIAVRNGNHFGAAGIFYKDGSQRKYDCFLLHKRSVGHGAMGSLCQIIKETNPFSLAMPMDEQPLFWILATSVVARGENWFYLTEKARQFLTVGELPSMESPTNNAREALERNRVAVWWCKKGIA